MKSYDIELDNSDAMSLSNRSKFGTSFKRGNSKGSTQLGQSLNNLGI